LEIAQALYDNRAPNLFDFDWNPLISLLLRPWFQQIWVIQEVAHARKATLILGSTSQKWDVLGDLITAMSFFSLPPQFAKILNMTRLTFYSLTTTNIMIMQKI
jgi:hypothetical protein